MKKHVSRTPFYPLEPVDAFIDGVSFDAPISYSSCSSAAFRAICFSPPATAAFTTGENVLSPAYHAFGVVAAKKDKIKRVLFFDGEEKPFSVEEIGNCNRFYADYLFSARVGKNELLCFTGDGDCFSSYRGYAFFLGKTLCKALFYLRGGRSLAYTQLLIVTDLKTSSDVARKLLSCIAADCLSLSDVRISSRAFDAAAFLSKPRDGDTACSEEISFARLSTLFVSMTRRFLSDSAQSACARFVMVSVKKARSAKEAERVAQSLLSRSIAPLLSRGCLFPIELLEAIAAEGADFSSAELSVCRFGTDERVVLVCDGRPLSLNGQTLFRAFDRSAIEMLVTLNAGNYSAEKGGFFATKKPL